MMMTSCVYRGLRTSQRLCPLCVCAMKKGEVNSVHILGVRGSGMLPVSAVAMAQGYEVRGSDDAKPECTDTHLDGLQLVQGRLQASDLPDVIIASSALSPLHPDLQMARQHSIPVLSRRQWFHRSLQNFCQITVSGTHGKTTTASMIAYVLHKMGVRVPFLVGGDIPQLPLSSIAQCSVGSSSKELIVVEADEYGGALLGLSPMVSVLTNVGYDHVDQFRTQQDSDDCFALFLGRMRRGGVLLANGDDEGCKRVVKQVAAAEGIVTWQEFVGMSGSSEQANSRLVLFFGFNRSNDITLHPRTASWDDHVHPGSNDGASWHSATRMMWAMPEIRHEEAFMGQEQAFASHFMYQLRLLGHHNTSNAAGAVMAAAISSAMFRNSFSTACEALSLGVAEVFASLQLVCQHVHTFKGTHRRLECLKSTKVGEGMAQKSIAVYDDYAHHPVEILATIKALAQAHEGTELWLVWEPITRSRLEHFLVDFVETLATALPETIIVGPIDEMSRENDDLSKDQELLLEVETRLNTALCEKGSSSDSRVIVADSWPAANYQLLSLLREKVTCSHGSGIVVVFMGAAKVTHAAHAFVDCELHGM